MSGPGPHVLYLVTEDWYFLSHRLEIARAARAAGCRVTVVTRETADGARIRDEGFRLLPIDFRRGRVEPLADARTLARLLRLYRRERPELVHHVALKPVLYGTLAARLTGVPAVVNALGGLGYLFASEGRGARAVRAAVMLAFRGLLDGRRCRTIVQNPDDFTVLTRGAGISSRRVAVIRGAGVDPQRFRPAPEPGGPLTVAMVSRMLWQKGVREFVEAARLLRARGRGVRMVLVGAPDPDNPAAVPERELRGWHEEGTVQWWGHREDIAGLWAGVHVCALPSYYREGLPKSLLEAAACGRPIVTTDEPGCREVVEDGENGLLVPARDAAALAAAIERLAADPELRRRMGARGRARVEREFSQERVLRETLELYRTVLGPRWPERVEDRRGTADLT